MGNWMDVIDFLVDKIRDAENMAEYYKAELKKLRAENVQLREQLGGVDDENALEATR